MLPWGGGGGGSDGARGHVVPFFKAISRLEIKKKNPAMIHCDQLGPAPKGGERDGWHGINRKWQNHVASIQTFSAQTIWLELHLEGCESQPGVGLSSPVARAHRECICRFVPLIASTHEIKRKKKGGGGPARGGRFWFKSSADATQLWSYFPPAPHPPEQRLLGFDLSFQLTLNELCSLLPQTQSGRAGRRAPLPLPLPFPASPPPLAKRTPWST